MRALVADAPRGERQTRGSSRCWRTRGELFAEAPARPRPTADRRGGRLQGRLGPAGDGERRDRAKGQRAAAKTRELIALLERLMDRHRAFVDVAASNRCWASPRASAASTTGPRWRFTATGAARSALRAASGGAGGGLIARTTSRSAASTSRTSAPSKRLRGHAGPWWATGSCRTPRGLLGTKGWLDPATARRASPRATRAPPSSSSRPHVCSAAADAGERGARRTSGRDVKSLPCYKMSSLPLTSTPAGRCPP